MDHTFDNLVRRKGYDAVLGFACLIPLDAAGTRGWARLASLTAGGRTCRPSCRRGYPISTVTAQASAINASSLGLSVTLGSRHPLCSRSAPIVSCQQECDKSDVRIMTRFCGIDGQADVGNDCLLSTRIVPQRLTRRTM